MGESLNPSLASRFSQLLRPDWARTMLARRVVAGGLVVLAGVATIRSDPQGDRVDVVVASRDIAPGTPLTAEDVSLESRSARTVPDGAATDLSSVLHTTLAGPARRGELLTDVRLLGSRLTEAAVGRDARIVGVHPADAALTDLVRTGDIVDIVAADDASDPSGAPKVLATGGIVVLVSDKQHHDDRVVLVALPATAAVAVAGATLAQAVTLTLR
ncbi:SAF domain-containing protein [Mycolicibacter senuensis]|uniref:Flagellar basal body P-ring biosynthesis protein n=1 Tax=Mycolicibacter senuensis TaxID=386913 RepID=A0A7I9XLJ0_9MYCO|nr:SAF domain-containing protein [Mycolicibacter senuensis]MDQ2628727.1 SAF domain-containing protein [Actinomycetota bacterium]ORW68866.1 flagellar biosynthesis protein FlgA [Mycolicibacter senuensis]GFG70608.1 flagellar basal body P-ring biosynthesis protein [Mycolicibacter senuensis]